MAVAETLKDKAGCGEPGEEKKKREKRVSESKRERERKKERKRRQEEKRIHLPHLRFFSARPMIISSCEKFFNSISSNPSMDIPESS